MKQEIEPPCNNNILLRVDSGNHTSEESHHTRHGAPKRYAKRWEHRYSAESLAQTPSPLKESAKTLDASKTTPLGTARPNPQYYPWQSMAMGATKEGIPGSAAPMSCVNGEASFDLSDALNYGFTAGSPELIRFFTSHIEKIHNPLYEDWDVCLSSGTTSAIDIAFRMFCNRGDWILMEEFTYSGTLTAAKAQGLKVLGIKVDHDGLDPEDLDSKLQNWDPSRGRKPFVLYTIPSGQNPTGTTQSPERKKAIYEVAERHDVYIIEDDPYYFLPLGDDGVDASRGHLFNSLEEFSKALPVSYLSMDTCGRVLRLDTVSKILAPGLRTGWVTGCSQIVDMYVAFAEVGTLSPSGASQVMLYKLLKESWGHEGFMNWLKHLCSQYRRRRDIMLSACKRYLPSEVCQWATPDVGMFIWVRVNLAQHPARRSQPQDGALKFHQEVEDRVHENAEEKGVLVAKGSWFTVESNGEELFFRVTFAAAPQEDLDEAIRKFGQIIREEFNL